MTNEEIWLKDLEKVKSFMDKYKMRPKKIFGINCLID